MYDNTTTLDLNNILTEEPVYTFTTADEAITITDTDLNSKTVIFESLAVAPGTYNIALTSPRCLINLRNGVTIAEGTSVDMGILLMGDANGDHKIDITDFGIVAAAYWTESGGEGWDERADFNHDGRVTVADLSLLAINFNKTSPQTLTEPD